MFFAILSNPLDAQSDAVRVNPTTMLEPGVRTACRELPSNTKSYEDVPLIDVRPAFVREARVLELSMLVMGLLSASAACILIKHNIHHPNKTSHCN